LQARPARSTWFLPTAAACARKGRRRLSVIVDWRFSDPRNPRAAHPPRRPTPKRCQCHASGLARNRRRPVSVRSRRGPLVGTICPEHTAALAYRRPERNTMTSLPAERNAPDHVDRGHDHGQWSHPRRSLCRAISITSPAAGSSKRRPTSRTCARGSSNTSWTTGLSDGLHSVAPDQRPRKHLPAGEPEILQRYLHSDGPTAYTVTAPASATCPPLFIPSRDKRAQDDRPVPLGRRKPYAGSARRAGNADVMADARMRASR
jgi:hypothetical protein